MGITLLDVAFFLSQICWLVLDVPLEYSKESICGIVGGKE